MSTSQSAEERKRKHNAVGVDRMKANHMSRQLQLRLQYARLKVDHGWQRQNLNEVENLYFHNSQMRLTKASLETGNGSMPPMFVPLTTPTVTGPIPTFRSFKFRPNLTPDMEPPSRNTISQTIASEPSTSGVMNIPLPNTTEQQGSSIAPEPPKSKDANSATPMAESMQSHVVHATPETQNTPSGTSIVPTNTPLTTDTPSVLSGQSSSQTSYNPYTALATTYTPSTPGQPAKAASSKLLSQLYPYGTPALTYDSFWSSHTGTNSQKIQKPTLGVTGRSPSSQTAEQSAVNNVNRSSSNLVEPPTDPPPRGVGDSRREQGNPA